MATTKKTTVKKTPRKTVAQSSKPKKTTTVKSTKVTKSTKASPTKKSSAKAKKTAALRSFRVYSDSRPFTEFRITRQTIYWIILISFIVFAQLWILKLQIEVATLIETQQIELQNF